MALVKKKEEEYTIKPEAVTPAVDTSSWPLLLKNYNNCMNLALITSADSDIEIQYLFGLDTLHPFRMVVPRSSAI
jgi:hypothetical protein